ncbi:GD16530 [Drosophila simulans]|uniref:GD16530 n=1 Tax=Drosophila simulans TaxID=7240 RepID=B4R7I3_DROSI|nr:GD16530 [Drosophila simulans]
MPRTIRYIYTDIPVTWLHCNKHPQKPPIHSKPRHPPAATLQHSFHGSSERSRFEAESIWKSRASEDHCGKHRPIG